MFEVAYLTHTVHKMPHNKHYRIEVKKNDIFFGLLGEKKVYFRIFTSFLAHFSNKTKISTVWLPLLHVIYNVLCINVLVIHFLLSISYQNKYSGYFVLISPYHLTSQN